MALLTILLLASASSAPVPRLSTQVSGVTTGLEIPQELFAGIGAGTGSLQLVINVITDSEGNIEMYTN